MFAEFTMFQGNKFLVAIDQVRIVIAPGIRPQFERCAIGLKDGGEYFVEESFDEIRKRLGLSITPRAETLCMNV